jgi:hypothetical protein
MVLLKWEVDMRGLVKGNTVEEKIASIESVLNSFQRRMHKTITVETPLVPFSLFGQGVVAGNIIGAFMFPMDCRLYDFSIVTDGAAFRRGILTITIVNGSEKHDHSYPIGSDKGGLNKSLINFNSDVKVGDRIIFMITSAEFAKAREGQAELIAVIDTIWISFLCVTGNKYVTREEFLTDTVIKSIELAEDL